MSKLDAISCTPTIVEETVEETNSAPMNAVVEIIYPPPEVRNIVDKTASFVARNGPEFEARIRQNEINNPKFNFLNTGNPYHAYYQLKVSNFREGKSNEITSALSSAVSKLSVSASAQQKQQEILKAAVKEPFVPQDPPVEFEFIADPPSISALDLDIVKLTAQFVARNGRQFLTQLMNREQRNFQFDFLRPQHSLFQYFTKLLEQYTKVLIPPKNLQNRLGEEAKTDQAVLEQVKYRAEWHKYQEAQKAKEEEILQRERDAYSQIDWHDFVAVETVDYQQFEIGNFPPPTTPEEVGARLLIQERIEDGKGIEMQLGSDEEEEPVARNPDEGLNRMEDRTMSRKKSRKVNKVDMEQDSSDEESEPKTQSHQLIQPPLPPVPDKVVVKKYDPKNVPKVTKSLVGDDYLISPITGEKILASKVQEHMKIGLLDPRWIEQRDKVVKDRMNENTVYAAGSAIDASLKQLAERRTDIFGVGVEETAIGKRIGEEDVRKDQKVTWDGYTSSVEAATIAARANITLEEQIHQIHKVKGLLSDEEKEKIGPKNVLNKGLSKAAAVITGKPQSNPNRTTVKPPQTIAPLQKPLQMSMVMQTHQQALLENQTQIMMMPASTMTPMIPPPLMMVAPPPMGGFVTPIPPQMAAANIGVKRPMDMGEEPMAKKVRNEDSLIPEEVFLAKNPNPVTLKVSIPLQPEKAEWKLTGQMLQFTMSLSESIASLKSKVQDDTSMPPAKQKLFFDGMFFKDSNTLAYYNITSGAVIYLQIKERGGRKK